MIIATGVLGAAAGIGGWSVLADASPMPNQGLLDQAVDRCEVPAPPLASPGPLIDGTFYSAHRGRVVDYVLGYPPGATEAARLPVCLVLHGLGSDQRSAFDGIGYHRLLAAAIGAGTPPFVLAAVAGGTGYWHPHDGDDPLGMLLTDFPVVLAQRGLGTDRFGLLGWSMGGYGALLAATEVPTRVAAVAASSPALWPSYEQVRRARPGAFDSAEQWRRWGDLAARAGSLRSVPVRIDIGESDLFTAAVRTLRDKLPDPSVVHIVKGCHDNAFWRSMAPEQLRLVGEALGSPA